MTDTMKDVITKQRGRNELREAALAARMLPLRSYGWAKVQAGLTTVEEVFRVVQD